MIAEVSKVLIFSLHSIFLYMSGWTRCEPGRAHSSLIVYKEFLYAFKTVLGVIKGEPCFALWDGFTSVYIVHTDQRVCDEFPREATESCFS